MRRITAMACSIILLALSASAPIAPAAAQGPPTEYSIQFTEEVACAFPVLVELRGKEKFIELPNGRFLLTSPGLSVTLTNLNDPSKRVTRSVTGAFHFTLLGDGSVRQVITGRNIYFDPLDPIGFVIAIGRFSLVYDAEGNLIEPLSGEGRLISVCELLD